jgi:hypothetical protein
MRVQWGLGVRVRKNDQRTRNTSDEERKTSKMGKCTSTAMTFATSMHSNTMISTVIDEGGNVMEKNSQRGLKGDAGR